MPWKAYSGCGHDRHHANLAHSELRITGPEEREVGWWRAPSHQQVSILGGHHVHLSARVEDKDDGPVGFQDKSHVGGQVASDYRMLVFRGTRA